MTVTFYRSAAAALGIAACGFLFSGPGSSAPAVLKLVAPGEANAIVGRPLTPGSVAGVARRTTRRVIRRTTYYVATLPAYCTATTIDGYNLYSCSGTYYQYYGGRYVVVYID
jgi:hypothetical protein